MCKISVVIPVYNVEKYIKKCYESIKEQNYIDWEIIFVVDGATDKSANVCSEISKDDNRVKVIETENYGVSHARNVGLQNISGEYVTFIDPDDYIEPMCFSSFVKKIEEANADMVFAKYYYKDDTKIKSSIVEFNEMNSKEVLRYHLQFKFISSICFGMYKTEYVKGLLLTEKLKSYEDWEFLFQMLQKSKRVVFCDDAFYHYETRIGSASKSEFNDSHMTAFYILEEVKNKIENKQEYYNELQCLRVHILLRIIVIYAARNCNNNSYKKIFRKIAREELIKIFKYKELDLKQKIYVLLIAINPNIYKKMFQFKNGGK